MKASKLLASIVVILVALGCTENDGNQSSSVGDSSSGGASASAAEMKANKEVGEAVAAVKALAGEKVEEFRKTMQTKLASLDEKIDQLKTKAAQAADSGKEKLRMSLKTLTDKREVLQKKLDELGAATAGAWKEMTEGLEAAYQDLEKAVGDAARQFDEAPAPDTEGAEKG